MPRFAQYLTVCSWIFALLVAARTSTAATATPAPTTATSDQTLTVKERVLRMTEFFDTMLPGTLGKYNMTLHFTPKFSDFRDHEFVRYPLELRYGATDRLELRTGLNPFGPNPVNSGHDHRWGPGEATFGARYDLARPLFFYDLATIGVDTRIPLGKPPVELNDHYTHIRPYLAVSRRLRSHPATVFYTNYSYDRSVKLTPRKSPPPEVTRRHIFDVTPGLLYKPAELGYFAEYSFQHIQEPLDWHLAHEVRFGTIWDVPLRRTAEWHLPGKWQLEIGYKFRSEQGQSTSQGLSARANWRTTLREVLTHVSAFGRPAN